MTNVFVEPQAVAGAAADVANIGSRIGAARAAAAGPTTGLVAAAEDEVSAATAQLFGAYGQQYQGLLQQAAGFHEQFVATLAAAGNAYSQAEGEIAGTLGLTGGAAAGPGVVTAAPGADPVVKSILIMTGSGTSTPSPAYLNAVFTRYMDGLVPGSPVFAGPLQAVSTAEGLYPFTGVKDLTLDISLQRGVEELDNAINLAITPGMGGPGNSVSVLGYSQSSIIASLEMPRLLSEGFVGSTNPALNQVYFTLLGDPANPNGGLLSRFPGLSFPSLGVTFGAATPSNDFPTTIWTQEYDGFADFPRYPIDVFSDLNALLGIVFVHGTYPTLTNAQLATAFLLPGSESLGTPNSMTDYYMIPTANLPLLDPVRAIPLVGTPIADLLQPDLRYIINWGYGDPNFGYSTSPANVPTPFGFLPPLSATTALAPLLVSGVGQGASAFVSDLSHLGSTSGGGGLSLPSLTSLLSGLGSGGGGGLPAPPSIQSIISGIQAANTNIVGTFTTGFSSAYAVLLPTADIGSAIAITLPPTTSTFS